MLIVLTVYQSIKARNFFARPLFLFLGQISFSLYLVHVPVIALIAPRLAEFSTLLNFGDTISTIFVFVIFMICVISVSWALILLDKVAILFSRKINSK